MGTRGRRSAASFEVAEVSKIEVVARADAPYDLTDEQTEEWWAVVNRLPADHFPRETHGMLAQYCRHIVSARRVAQLIADLEDGSGGGDDGFDVDGYDRLLKMQEREGRAISSLATRMRISQQSTVSAKSGKPKVAKPLWQR